MAAGTMAANAATIVAFVLAVLWIVAISVPWSWQSSQSFMFNFKASLLTLQVSKGTVTSVVAGAVGLVKSDKASQILTDLFERKMWMDEGANELCQSLVEMVFKWCNTWQMLKFASWGMFACGLLTAILLALGGCFTYYYAYHHATHTGRISVKVNFILAPLFAMAGLSQYVALTLDFGQMGAALTEPTHMYDTAFILSCALCLLSWVPFYIFLVFMRKNPNEKYGPREDAGCFVDTNEGYGATTNNIGVAYVNMAPKASDAFGLSPPAPQSGAYYGPQMGSAHGAQAAYMAGPAPGMRGAAW